MTVTSVQLENHVAVVTFSNPPVNYFNPELLTDVADAMEEAVAAQARAIVLRSEGRHFCAGADFSVIGTSARDRTKVAEATYAAGLRLFGQVLPVVAAIQGAAIGGGLGLACAADFRVVTPSSRLEANFTRLGFHPGFGLSASLPHIVGQRSARAMLLTSRSVVGIEALEVGLAELVVEENQLVDAAVNFASELAALAPLAVQSVKETLNRPLLEEVQTVLKREADEQARLWGTEDADIGIGAAKRREIPQFVGR